MDLGRGLFKMEQDMYSRFYSMDNLLSAWRNARKEKGSSKSVIAFEENLEKNLIELHYELKNKTYSPKPLTTFILRDPKTRKISKSDFRDRVVHHALILVIGKIFEKGFIYDSCANQIGKGNLFAIKRFDYFKKKATKNNTRGAFCLKADIKHYFDEVNHNILLNILKDKIKDVDLMNIIYKIVKNCANSRTQRERDKFLA